MSTTEQIPFLDLIALHKELEDELLATLRDTLRVAGFVGGPKVEEFEREFAKFCDAIRIDRGGRKTGRHCHHRSAHLYRNHRGDKPSRWAPRFCRYRRTHLLFGSSQAGRVPRASVLRGPENRQAHPSEAASARNRRRSGSYLWPNR